MNVKDGVLFNGVRGVILRAMASIEPIMEASGEFTITSVKDGTHGPNSFHYVGCAFDLRTRHLQTPERVESVAKELRETLGNSYQVIVEKDHIHIEISPQWVALNGDPRKVA
jgi:hypothetical protein